MGRALVAHAVHWLWTMGSRRAVVNTQWGNRAAMALYLSAGFVEVPSGLFVLACEL